MSVMLVRHGPTDFNKDQGNVELMRGWNDIPLNEDGSLLAQNVAQSLKDCSFFGIWASDLARTVATAQEISVVLNKPFNVSPNFRPWDFGYLTGMPVEEAHKELQFYIDHPKERISGGESLQTFIDRFIPAIKPLIMSKQRYLVVSHSRNCNLAIGLCMEKGKSVNSGPMRGTCAVEPAGLLILNSDWTYEILNPTKELLKRPKRADKASVLYMHVVGTNYQCRDCVTFIPGSERCLQHGKSDVIKPYGGCGLFAHGTPVPGLEPTGAVTKQQSGYIESRAGFTCGRCEYFLSERRDCIKVDPDSPGDDPGEIRSGGCCNAWEEDD